MRNILILLCSLFFVTSASCASSLPRSSGTNATSDTVLDHSITYRSKGTRSEARDGHLSYKGSTIPDLFTFIRDSKAEYRFYIRKNMWGNGGYFPVESSGKEKSSENTASDSELERGWYEGEKRLSNTPSTWIYVEWENGHAYTAPESIESMAKALNLQKIQRQLTPVLMGE